MLRRTYALRFFTYGVASLTLVACGGDDKPANTGQPGAVQCPPGQYFDGQFCRMASPQPATAAQPGTAAAPAAGQPPVAGVPAGAGGQPAAGVPPVATAQPGAQATAIDPTMAQAATALLGGLAQQHAPAGAQPLGGAIAGNFQQGQSLETQVQMQPGKCYTVIAAGLPPIQNLDIQFLPMVPVPGVASPIIAQDQTTGPTAILGEKPDCFKWPLPVAGPMKVVVTASQGQGLAAAQVYEK